MKINFISLIVFFSLCTSSLPSQAMNDDYFEIQRQKQAAVQKVIETRDQQSYGKSFSTVEKIGSEAEAQIKQITKEYDSKVDSLIQNHQK